MSTLPSDPKTAALVRAVLDELEWLARHQQWEAFPALVSQRFSHLAALGMRLRDEDLRQFPMDLMLAAQLKNEQQVLGFFTLAVQFFVGMGMVGAWATIAEQLAAHAAEKLVSDSST